MSGYSTSSGRSFPRLECNLYIPAHSDQGEEFHIKVVAETQPVRLVRCHLS